MTAKHLTDRDVELSVRGSVAAARVRIEFGHQVLLLDFADALQLADNLVDTVERTRKTRNHRKKGTRLHE
ncbi:hypothetical protein [Rhodococcoides fascians]|uniref:hypothetical protein n=1 Tax=Rhodococcoides fascians TaxID=1828 RepID=UPI00055BDD5E|nr:MULTISPECIES: hypothetical protein [Rhodococcus]OZF00556.1 hypothetical protein CH301_12810 [Rhodococcus sp. 15-1189-1-1a]OZF14435.1 hypothetical protein CH299_13490 [Rhodococcus sp. 14-2686-1-2]